MMSANFALVKCYKVSVAEPEADAASGEDIADDSALARTVVREEVQDCNPAQHARYGKYGFQVRRDLKQDRGIALPNVMAIAIAITLSLCVGLIWLGPETRGRNFNET